MQIHMNFWEKDVHVLYCSLAILEGDGSKSCDIFSRDQRPPAFLSVDVATSVYLAFSHLDTELREEEAFVQIRSNGHTIPAR